MRDPDLSPVLDAASPEALFRLSALLEQERRSYTPPQPLDSPEGRAALEQELRRAGGDSVANLVRGEGPSWERIARAAGKKLGVKDKELPLEALEQRVAARLLVAWVERLDPEGRARVEAEVFAPLEPTRRASLRAAAAREGGATEEDFSALLDLLRERAPSPEGLEAGREAMGRWLAGKAATRAAIQTLLKLLGLGTNPLGWTLTGVSVALQLAGPAYRVTLPAVVWVAVQRAGGAEIG